MFQIVGRPVRAMLLSLALAACRNDSPVAPEPEQGVLEVEVVTSGVELASGYSLLLEGRAVGERGRPGAPPATHGTGDLPA